MNLFTPLLGHQKNSEGYATNATDTQHKKSGKVKVKKGKVK